MIRLAFALLLSLCVSAQAQLSGGVGGFPGPGTVHSSAYVGPGDVVSKTNLKFYVGLRALDAADRGNQLINLCNVADAACVDVSSDATTGALAAPTNVGGTDCTAINTCTIKTWYDRSGALFCAAGTAACNFTQATIANRATFTWNCLNSKPCAVFNGTTANYQTSSTLPSLSTFTVSSISVRTANFTTQQMIFSTQGATSINLNYRALANAVQMFAGTGAIFVSNITDNNFHALQAIFNGASSALVCGGTAGTNCSSGGTSNSLSPGANSSTGGVIAAMATSGGGSFLSGNISEMFLYNTAISGSDTTALNNNQYGYWGPF